MEWEGNTSNIGQLRLRQAARERERELLAENESLKGALQAVLTRVDAALDRLVPPGARVEEASDLLEDAIVVIREELDV